MKVCFITSIIADDKESGDRIKNFPKNPNHDYFLFTNLNEKEYDTPSGSWTPITIKSEVLEGLKSNVYKSRYVKFLGWKYLKTHLKKEYDMIVYCDAVLYPKNSFNWDKLYEQVKTHGIVQRIHPKNKNGRDAYSECDAVIKTRKDSETNMENLKNFLMENSMPKGCLFTENKAFAYDPKNKKIIEAFEYFWEIYKKGLTHRDQSLWSYVLWKTNIQPYINKDSDMRHAVWDKNFPFKLTGSNKGFKCHKYV